MRGGSGNPAVYAFARRRVRSSGTTASDLPAITASIWLPIASGRLAGGVVGEVGVARGG